MGTGAITSYFDIAQLVLYMFWIGHSNRMD